MQEQHHEKRCDAGDHHHVARELDGLTRTLGLGTATRGGTTSGSGAASVGRTAVGRRATRACGRAALRRRARARASRTRGAARTGATRRRASRRCAASLCVAPRCRRIVSGTCAANAPVFRRCHAPSPTLWVDKGPLPMVAATFAPQEQNRHAFLNLGRKRARRCAARVYVSELTSIWVGSCAVFQPFRPESAWCGSATRRVPAPTMGR